MSGGASLRTYTQATLKKLCALSYNQCAFPSCEQPLSKPEWPRMQAAICHISGLRPDSPRYDSSMTDGERNSYENLILLCPNCHNLIDHLEPTRFDLETLIDMKHAHEAQRHVGREWCTPEELAEIVSKLALTANLIVLASGASSPRDPIRSSRDPTPAAQVAELRRPTRGKNMRIHQLAAELGMTNDEVIDLCGVLGVPVKAATSSLNEAYADMVRRRAKRDGLTREHQPPKAVARRR